MEGYTELFIELHKAVQCPSKGCIKLHRALQMAIYDAIYILYVGLFEELYEAIQGSNKGYIELHRSRQIAI